MSDVTERPLVTFALFAYNQERYIREAVEAALAQDYSLLEIIISDDCSTDATYGWIEKLAEMYIGEHVVKVRRSECNRGLANHVSDVLDISNGTIVVMAAGDDISMPHRVSTIVESLFNETEMAVFSNSINIDKNGSADGRRFERRPMFASGLNDYLSGVGCWTHGATLAFKKKEVYDRYGRIDPSVKQEDGCLAFRSILQGGLLYLEKPLVFYRTHEGNLSQSKNPAVLLNLKRSEYRMIDMRYSDAMASHRDHIELIRHLSQARTFGFAMHLIYNTPFFGYLIVTIKMLLGKIRRGLK